MTEDEFLEYWDKQTEESRREMQLEERRERDRIRRAIFQLAIIAGGQDPDELNAHIRVLVKERDEARRLCCQIESDTDPIMAMQIASKRGWDCFKEASK